jgi:hypothetical protein
MQLEFALFCEAAEVSDNGLIYILHGGYDLVSTTAFPAVLNRVSLVVRFLVEPKECKREHRLIAQMIGPRGDVLPVPMECNFTTPSYPGKPKRRNRTTLRLDYWNLMFPEPGDYAFRFLVDGKKIGQSELEVKKKGKG